MRGFVLTRAMIGGRVNQITPITSVALDREDLMATLFGRRWTRGELCQYAGRMEQLAGIRAVEHVDGRARGTRGFEVWTGSGLTFHVLADRALDISTCSLNGKALGWLSPGDEAHPAFFEPHGLGWLRNWGGGLLSTCGLDHFGSPSEDGEAFGIHGRIGNLPAEQVSYRTYWAGDDYRLEISGVVRQARPFGENLLLRRRISTALGASALTIDDEVVNEGHEPIPHMILYHFNLGFPLISPATELDLPISKVAPRTERAAAALDRHLQMQPPTPGFQEEVFIIEVKGDTDARATARITNRANGVAAELSWGTDTLPYLMQWKMMGEGMYVLGIEPGNTGTLEGRAEARRLHMLSELAPGESRRYSITFAASTL